jgi:hypothetical protein
MSIATASNALPLLLRQGAPEAVEAGLLPVPGDVQHAAPLQIVHQREVVAAPPERLLVHAQMAHRPGRPPRQSALHRAVHHGVDLVPAQPQTLGHRLLARRLQPLDGKPFEQRREPAAGLGPRQTRHPDAVLGAVGARRAREEDRLELARVEVPPLPLPLVVVKAARLAALRARPRLHPVVLQVYVDLARLQFQFHTLHPPCRLDSQNVPVQFAVLHARQCLMGTGRRPLQSRNTHPECSNCGCIASMALAAVGKHKIAGVLPVEAIFKVSVRIGRMRTKGQPVAEPHLESFKILK